MGEQITWGELKKLIESEGVKDEDVICYVDVWEPHGCGKHWVLELDVAPNGRIGITMVN